MRKAALVGGIATGALLFAGSAAQAEEVAATPEALGGLPLPTDSLPVPTDALPGLDGLSTGAVPGLDSLPTGAVPGLGGALPSQTAPAPAATTHHAANAANHTDRTVDSATQGSAPAGSPVDDLLGSLGGGLPVPLPF